MNRTRRLIVSALMLALAFVLPFLTAQIPQIGIMLLPMHIPVLLCGFICGPLWGTLVGFVSPLLRSLVLGMPSMMPTALCMAFELAAYGFFAALFAKLFFRKGMGGILPALVLTMLCGRAVWGVVSFLVYHLVLNKSFTFPMFMAGAFVSSWPGILIQLVLIPCVMLALQKAHLISLHKETV